MNKILLIVWFVGLAACTNKKKDEEGREPVQAMPPPATGPASSAGAGGGATSNPAPAGAAAGSAPSNPAGAVTAEADRRASGGATIPTPDACATASKRACGAGQVDGCTGGMTSVHVCVAGDAQSGAPCAQGPSLTCPTGQLDACSFAPPYASNHVCVVVPKPTP